MLERRENLSPTIVTRSIPDQASIVKALRSASPEYRNSPQYVELCKHLSWLTARKKDLGAVESWNLSNPEPTSWQIVFNPPCELPENRLDIWIDFGLLASKMMRMEASVYNTTSREGAVLSPYFRQQSRRTRVIDSFAPALLPVNLQNILEDAQSKEITPFKEKPATPWFCLVTDDQEWAERTTELLQPAYSAQESMVVSPQNAIETLEALPEKPLVVCLGCDFAGNQELFSQFGAQYSDCCILVFLNQGEITFDITRLLLNNLNTSPYKFDHLLSRHPEDQKAQVDIIQAFSLAPEFSVKKWANKRFRT